jgi:perosamine synthetase
MSDRHGIPARRYFNPIHEQPYIVREFGQRLAPLPVTDSISKRTLAIPFHNNLTLDQIDRVVDVLEQAVSYAS